MIGSRFGSRRSVQILLAALLFPFSILLPAAPSPSPTPPQAVDEKLFEGLQWRQIGPFRGGRPLTIEGEPGDPDNCYLCAVPGGGREAIYGRAEWTPLFAKG